MHMNFHGLRVLIPWSCLKEQLNTNAAILETREKLFQLIFAVKVDSRLILQTSYHNKPNLCIFAWKQLSQFWMDPTLSRKYSHLNIDSFGEKVALRRILGKSFWSSCVRWLAKHKVCKIVSKHGNLRSLATSSGECNEMACTDSYFLMAQDGSR